MMLAGTE